MQFIKKNYEKILLGLVLVGLVVVAVFLLFLVANEKQQRAEQRNSIIQRPVKPLPELNLTQSEAMLRRLQATVILNFSDSTNRLFNPERWQKPASGPLIKNPPGIELLRMEVVKIGDLFFNVTLDSATTSDSGTRYNIGVEQQAALKSNMRGRRSFFVSKGEKKEYGEKKETFLIQNVEGTPDSPILVIEFSDLDQPLRVSKEKPYRRVDGHTVDMKYPPENRNFLGRREGDKIVVAGEEYTVVRITENEVTLLARNQKKWTIKFNPTALNN